MPDETQNSYGMDNVDRMENRLFLYENPIYQMLALIFGRTWESKRIFEYRKYLEAGNLREIPTIYCLVIEFKLRIL